MKIILLRFAFLIRDIVLATFVSLGFGFLSLMVLLLQETNYPLPDSTPLLQTLIFFIISGFFFISFLIRCLLKRTDLTVSIFSLIFWIMGSTSVYYLESDTKNNINPASINPFSENLMQKSDITVDSLISSINSIRLKNNLEPLILNEKLNESSKLKNDHLCEHQYWAHVAPDGTTPWSFLERTNYIYQTSGENLGRDFMDTNSLVTAWMQSETHRYNILHKDFTEIGFSIIQCNMSGINTILVTNHFGKPMTNKRVTLDSNIIQTGNNINPNSPVHCPISLACGGGTTPLTYGECQQTVCCRVGESWKFLSNQDTCLNEQKKSGNVSHDSNYTVAIDNSRDPNEPVHCNISPNCGGGTTPLTYAECQNSVCCQINDHWVFYKDRQQCLFDQKNSY